MGRRAREPEISVVVLAQRDSAQLRLMLRSLRAQSVAPRLGLIVVTPADRPLALRPEDVEGLHGAEIVEVVPVAPEGAAKAAGVRAARSPLVAFAEDHSYPAPGWAAAMIEAHRELEDAAVVGPVMGNANPDSAVSWGCFLIYYGHWLAGRGRERVGHVPANQSCYKRAALLAYGERLAELLQSESVLHWDLAARGQGVVLDSAARVFHLNHSNLTSATREYFWASRIFAASRAAGWRAPRRACYALGSPLLPAVRLRRVLRETRRAALEASVVARALAPALLILGAGAAGELLGYATGPGDADARLADMLRHSARLVSRADLAQVARLQEAR